MAPRRSPPGLQGLLGLLPLGLLGLLPLGLLGLLPLGLLGGFCGLW